MSGGERPTNDERGSRDAEVIVIGAGAAGLAAGRRLAEGGRSVLLLEARGRPGGRIWTADNGFELGAEFVHGHPKVTLDLLRESGAGLEEYRGEHWVSVDGRIERDDDITGALEPLLERARRAGPDRSVDDFLREVERTDPPLRAAAAWMRGLVESFDAADTTRASLRSVVREWSGDAAVGSALGRPRGGYAPLVDHMVRALDPTRVELALESTVREVRWSAGGVTVDAERRGVRSRHRARAVVVTVPVGVLQVESGHPSAIRFEPPLDGKRRALDGIAAGPALRVLLDFHEPFWERLEGGRWRDASFFHGTTNPFRVFWTALPHRRGWITAWTGGPAAAALSAEPHDTVVREAVRCLQSIFGDRVDVAGLLRETRAHDWQRDPHSLGAYSYLTIGGDDSPRILAEPVANTLFFAGEATADTGEAGTVAGALLSGRRAAEEVLEGLQTGDGGRETGA